MSIIHEALKKAEREREPRPTRLPFYGGARTVRRRWRRDAATGMLIGLTTVGAVTSLAMVTRPRGEPFGQHRRPDDTGLASNGARR